MRRIIAAAAIGAAAIGVSACATHEAAPDVARAVLGEVAQTIPPASALPADDDAGVPDSDDAPGTVTVPCPVRALCTVDYSNGEWHVVTPYGPTDFPAPAEDSYRWTYDAEEGEFIFTPDAG